MLARDKPISVDQPRASYQSYQHMDPYGSQNPYSGNTTAMSTILSPKSGIKLAY